MKTLLPYALAIGAVAYLELAVRKPDNGAGVAAPHVPNLDELLGRPTTFGDGVLSSEERTYCEAQAELRNQLAAMEPFDAFVLCAKNPKDLRCRGVDDACFEDGAKDFAKTIRPLSEHAANAARAIAGALGGAIGGVFGNIAWLAVGGAVFYFAVVRS